MSLGSSQEQPLTRCAFLLVTFGCQGLVWVGRLQRWPAWRMGRLGAKQFPTTYFLWAARLSANDKVERMVIGAQALVKTYMEGAGILGWLAWMTNLES